MDFWSFLRNDELNAVVLGQHFGHQMEAIARVPRETPSLDQSPIGRPASSVISYNRYFTSGGSALDRLQPGHLADVEPWVRQGQLRGVEARGQVSEWTVWRRVETYRIYVRQTDRGNWDGGYASLTGSRAEMRTPTLVTLGDPSQDAAADAVERYLKSPGPTDGGGVSPVFSDSLGSGAGSGRAVDGRSARSGNLDAPDLAGRPRHSHRPRVLCIDDDQLLLVLFRDTLEAQGFEPLTAADGRSGIEIAQKERPDLILVDVLMPRMSGYDVCRTLRSVPGFQNTPIILFTALADPRLEAKALAAGATRAFPKLFNLEKLMDVLRVTIEKGETFPPA